MVNYPTQLDEIDQWLADNFGIMPGACSSMENLRHNTARMIAEALWQKCKDSLHIQEMCKENGDSFTDDIDGERDQVDKLEKVAEEYAKDETMAGLAERAFKAGANWQREQFHDACYQCEKNYDNVFFKGEQHAIKMMKEEAAEGMVGRLTVDGADNRCEITVIMPYAMLKRLGMLGYGYGVYITKSGKNR